MIVLYSTIRERPGADAHGVDDLASSEISAEGETYEAALARLQAQVPERWQLLGLARWPLS